MARNPSENPVVLSRIYTRTGDDGSTALSDGSRTAKTDSRLAAYADVEEANCAIGTAITFGDLAPDIAALLTRVQNELFDVGADLANPVTDKPAPQVPLRIDEAYVTRDRKSTRLNSSHMSISYAVFCLKKKKKKKTKIMMKKKKKQIKKENT